MCIGVGLKETREVVSVSENTSGFDLSESALKDLSNRKAPCGCPRRTISRINQTGFCSRLVKAIGTVWNDVYGNTLSLAHLLPVSINHYKW